MHDFESVEQGKKHFEQLRVTQCATPPYPHLQVLAGLVVQHGVGSVVCIKMLQHAHHALVPQCRKGATFVNKRFQAFLECHTVVVAPDAYFARGCAVAEFGRKVFLDLQLRKPVRIECEIGYPEGVRTEHSFNAKFLEHRRDAQCPGGCRSNSGSSVAGWSIEKYGQPGCNRNLLLVAVITLCRGGFGNRRPVLHFRTGHHFASADARNPGGSKLRPVT